MKKNQRNKTPPALPPRAQFRKYISRTSHKLGQCFLNFSRNGIILTCILPMKCINSGGFRIFIQEKFVGVGRGYSRSTLFITQIFVYLECLGGREQRLMEILALLKHPMSTTRLFLNERPQITLHFYYEPQNSRDSFPYKRF